MPTGGSPVACGKGDPAVSRNVPGVTVAAGITQEEVEAEIEAEEREDEQRGLDE